MNKAKLLLTAILILLLSPLVMGQNKSVALAEYYWDTDPGIGNGTALTSQDGNFDEAIESLTHSTTSLPLTQGVHRLYIRIKDINNNWSPSFGTVVVIDASSTTLRNIKITAGEYFWDTDPGAGSGLPLIAFDGNFDQAIETAIGSTTSIPAVGVHKIGVRFRDAESAWSSTFSYIIQIDSSVTALRNIKITAGEYFWDTDPGIGLGTALLVIDGTFDDVIESLTATASMGLSTGVHVLHVRMRDAESQWSAPFRVIISIFESEVAQRSVYVAAGECWFDTDPGPGLGTPILSQDGSFDEVIEAMLGGSIPSPVLSGMHVLWIRAKDPQGGWGPKFGIVVNMDIDIGTFTTSISGATTLCSGSSQLGVVYTNPSAAGATYSWTVNGGVIISGQGTSSVTVNWNTVGTHSISLTQCIGSNCQTDTETVQVVSASNVTQNITICQGESYFAGGANQTTSGTYTDLQTNAQGCQYTRTTVLTVLSNVTSSRTVNICQGETFFVGGGNQSQSGTYVDVLTTTSGCDSTVTTTLIVRPNYNQNVLVNICQGQSYFAGGANQTQAGFYTDVFQSAFGCDSIVVTQLVVNTSTVTNNFVTICEGQSYFAGGANQTTSGAYTDIIDNGSGCGETLITHLTVTPVPDDIEEDVQLCTGGSYSFYNQTITSAGTYTQTLGTTCTYTHTIHVTLTNAIVTNTTAHICDGESILLAGSLQTTEGVYTDVFESSLGCDSIVTTTLVVHATQSSQQNIQICQGQSYYAGGALQTSAGVYTDTYQSQYGCDSTVVTILSVLTAFNTNTTAHICEGESILLGGSQQTTAGVYTDLFESIGGCDSIVVTTLIVHEITNETVSAQICEGESIFLGGALQTTAGAYTDVYQNQYGCDSIVVTLLSISAAPATPSIFQNGNLLTCSVSGSSYVWMLNGNIIANASTQTIDASDYITIAGEFQVAVVNGCTSEFSPILGVILSIAEFQNTSIILYPNPSRDYITISGKNLSTNSDIVSVIDLTGREVIRQPYNNQAIQIESLAAGIYQLRLLNNESIIWQGAFIKE